MEVEEGKPCMKTHELVAEATFLTLTAQLAEASLDLLSPSWCGVQLAAMYLFRGDSNRSKR